MKELLKYKMGDKGFIRGAFLAFLFCAVLISFFVLQDSL